MKHEDLLPGRMYRLCKPVVNPCADRRRAPYMFRTEVFPVGLRLVLYREDGWMIFGPNLHKRYFAAGRNTDGVFHLPVRQKDDRLWSQALVPELVEAPIDSPELLFEAFGVSVNRRIFTSMLEHKALTFEQLRKFFYDTHTEMQR